MSTISISYNSLKDASSEAKSVAKKLDYYADSIKSDIYNKFNNYEGTWSSNITTGRNNINSKISELRNKSDKYEIYANNLIDLRDQCKTTDKAVKQKVSTLTATFKSNHGIKNSKIQNTFSYLMTSIGNSTSAGRWLGDGKDMLDEGQDYLKECIEDWYEFEGGGDFLKGIFVAALEIAIAVITVIGAVTALAVGGGVLAIILAAATLVGGIIAGVNGITNLVNEGRALKHTMNDDPATGKRRSSEDTLTDTIRTESDSKSVHILATGIDVVKLACSVITIFDSFGGLLKNGYRWTTGVTSNLKDIKIKDVLTKSNFKDFGKKIGSTIRNGWIDVKSAVDTKDWNFIRTLGNNFKSDFFNNLKGKYADFSTMDKKFESTKNIFNGTKSIIEDGFNAENIIKTIAVPIIPITDLPSAPGKDKEGISAGDFIDLYDDFKDDVLDSSLFDNDFSFNADILKKLSEKSDIKIEIPQIHVPVVNIKISKLNVA